MVRKIVELAEGGEWHALPEKGIHLQNRWKAFVGRGVCRSR